MADTGVHRRWAVQVLSIPELFPRGNEAARGWPEGRPGLEVMDCCPNLIRALPVLSAEQTRPEVADTRAEDHAYDALGHVLASIPGRPERQAWLWGCG